MNAPAQRTVAGKYALDRKLGQGAMGSVWAAEHVSLRSQVAIKFIDPQIASDPEALARFLREARAAAALRSPHVVQILDHGVDNGAPYIVMELLEGETLGNRLRRQGALPRTEVADLLTQVARAMTKAHEAGIVHRDLKPDNIFIVQNDDAHLAKVLDFGIAKVTAPNVAGSAPGTRSGALMGTPVYMSPEQAEGTKSVDFRSDLWSLGVIAYECLLGRRPFEGEAIGSLVLAICSRPMPIPSRAGEVPAGFDEWFARACARDPTQRFLSAKEQAQELKQILDRQPSVPSTASSTSRPSDGSQRSDASAASILAATTAPTFSSQDRRPVAPSGSVGRRALMMLALGTAIGGGAWMYWGSAGRPETKTMASTAEGAPAAFAPSAHSLAEDPRQPSRATAEPAAGSTFAASASATNAASVASIAASAPAASEARKAPMSARPPEKPVAPGRLPSKASELETRDAQSGSPLAPSPVPTPTVNLGI